MHNVGLFVYVRPFVCLSVCLPGPLSVCQTAHACPYVRFSTRLCMFACLSVCPSGCVCLSLSVSVCLPGFACLSVCLSACACLSVWSPSFSVPGMSRGMQLRKIVRDMDGSSHCGLIMVPSQEAFGDNLGIFFYFLHNNYMLSILIRIASIRRF